jgi:hypothetical protein
LSNDFLIEGFTMASQFDITIKGIPEIREMLKGIEGGADKAIARALNKTAHAVESDAAKKITEKLNVTQGTVKKDFKLCRATYTKLTAAVRSKGKPVALGKTLRVRQIQRGVSVMVKRDKPRKVIRHAFIGKIGSHKGVFQRTYTQKSDYKPVYPIRDKKFYGHLPRKYRLPAKELFGPRVPDIFSNQDVMGPILQSAGERLEKNMGHEAEFVLQEAAK